MAAHHVIAISGHRESVAQDGGEDGPLQAGHLVQCNAPVTFNYVHHLNMGIPQPTDVVPSSVRPAIVHATMKLLRRSSHRRHPRPVTGVSANHGAACNQQAPDSQDMRPLKKPVKRCCPELVAKSVAAAILGAIAVMAAVLIAMHFLEPRMADMGTAAEKAPSDHAPELRPVLANVMTGRDTASSVFDPATRRTDQANGTGSRDPAYSGLAPAPRRTDQANGTTSEDPAHSTAISTGTTDFMAGGDAATTASTKIASHGNASCEPLGETLPCRLPGNGSSEECPRFYSRVQWGARPPNKRVPMIQPIRYVVVSHTTQSRCNTLASCSRLIRSMQEYHLSRRYDDLAYSFLVSDDGSVYEGRGWGRASSHLGDRGDTALGLGFVGDYRRAGLTVHQSRSAALLLDYGTRCSHLSTDYLLVAHNQTRLTQSPGEFVFREIRGWPHYSDIRLF